MALSPLNNVEVDIEDIGVVTESDVQPSKTYVLDLTSGAIGVVVDGSEAIKQFVLKAILTARYNFTIYDEDYGCELEDVIGQDVSQELIRTEIPRVITEALIYDDRIADVYDFDITQDGDKLYVSFYVDTDDEEIPIEVVI